MGELLILASFVTFGTLLAWWGVIEWRRYKARRALLDALAQMTIDLRQLQIAIGEALMPAMKHTVEAFNTFAKTWQTVYHREGE